MTPPYLVHKTVSPSLIALGQALADLYASGARPHGIVPTTRRRVEAGVAKLQTVESVAKAYGKRVVWTLEDADAPAR